MPGFAGPSRLEPVQHQIARSVIACKRCDSTQQSGADVVDLLHLIRPVLNLG